MRRGKETAFDDDNPEWTRQDFARAKRPEEALPQEVLGPFKKAGDPQKAMSEVPIPGACGSRRNNDDGKSRRSRQRGI